MTTHEKLIDEAAKQQLSLFHELIDSPGFDSRTREHLRQLAVGVDHAAREEERERVSRELAQVNRLKYFMEGFAERDCTYGDNCPKFGTKHGPCVGCLARTALEVK